MATAVLWGTEFYLNRLTQTDAEWLPKVKGLANGGFVAVWQTSFESDIIMRLFNADGTPKTAEISVSTTIVGNQRTPDITVLANGRYVVTWVDRSSGSPEIRARIFNPDGSVYDRNGNGLNDDQDFIVNMK